MSIFHTKTISYLSYSLLVFSLLIPPVAAELNDKTELQGPALQASLLFTPFPEIRSDVLSGIAKRGKQDMVAALIYALRYLPNTNNEISNTLSRLTGAYIGTDWSDWMRWQQAHPKIVPFPGFSEFQSDMFSNIDPAFRTFISPGVRHEIRLEEIVWGGVKKDGIPALNNPEFISADKADYLGDNEAVFGIEINGDVRAYPYRIMDWHEMFNDVIGGVPVALAYCTLCGSAILYHTEHENFDAPLIFGSSGFLYRSNKLMYDQLTHSLWNQFTGRPVVGELSHSGVELKILPVVTTTWGEWRKQHPNSRVLSPNTGFRRDYSPGKPYGKYFASSELMFPALSPDKRLRKKDVVFGLRVSGAEKAWPLKVFKDGKVINDRIGTINLVLIGDSASRTVRAYRSGGKIFDAVADDLSIVKSKGQEWIVSEEALMGPANEKLSRLPGHLAYWFAWSNYLGKSELYQP